MSESNVLSYSAVIVTFGRPESLRLVLSALIAQTAPPELIVVVDNDPRRSAEVVLNECDPGQAVLVYAPSESNVGPAGGWAHGVELARLHELRGEWVAIFDDDDGLLRLDVMHRLASAVAKAGKDHSIAAVGLRGARLCRATGLLQRVDVNDGDMAQADYLASGGTPMYRWRAIEAHGFFDPTLFFGFEDLDLGLRWASHGERLMVFGISDHVVQNTAATRTAWREYFKSRALVIIVCRHLGSSAKVATVARIVLGSAFLFAKYRTAELAAARLRGVVDGIRGRPGSKKYLPTANPAKVRSQ